MSKLLAIKASIVAFVVALASPVFASAAAQTAVVTALQAEVTTLTGHAYTILIAVLIAFIGMKLFKRFTNKATG